MLYKNGGAGAESDIVTVMYFLLPISTVWTSIFVSEFFFSDRTRDVLFFYSRKKRFAVSQLFFLLPLANVAVVTLLHFSCLSYSVSMAVKLLCIGVLFYGIAMLDKFKGLGWKKPYLIFGMCDETFSINCTVTPPEGVDRGWFMFFVTLLNQTYWVAGATLGALLGFRDAAFVSLLGVFASPTAVNSFTMAQQMGGDAELAGDTVVVTSAVSMLTMFLWVFLFKSLGMF